MHAALLDRCLRGAFMFSAVQVTFGAVQVAMGSPGISILAYRFNPPLAACPERRPVTRISATDLTSSTGVELALVVARTKVPSPAIDAVLCKNQLSLVSG